MASGVEVAPVWVEGLSRRYGAVRALDDVAVGLGRGVTGLLGPNGAGKTTLMTVLATVNEPDAGRVSVFGLDPADGNQRVAIRRRLGYLPQELSFHRHFGVAGFLDYVAILKEIVDRRRRAEEVARVLTAVGLENLAGRRVRSLSGGMRQRLGVAQALLGGPGLLVLDEPTAGLDPEQRLRFRELLSDLPDDPVVLLSTHQVDDISAICPRVLVLLGGRVCFEGSPADLAATAAGRVWAADERDTRALLSWRSGDNRWRHLGEHPPEGAEEVPPTVEEGYLLLSHVGDKPATSAPAVAFAAATGAMSQPAGQVLHVRTGAGTPRSEPGAAAGQYRASAPPFRLRVALELGRAEAWLLLRSLVVLAGLLAGFALASHYMNEGAVSFWWAAGWEVGYGQMFLSATVLATAQLATGRARRNGMGDLYEGFPVSASTRVAGHLFSLAGALPASLVLIAATSALTEWHGAIGRPDPVALAAGALLVVTGGTIGVALGARFPHPLVGVLGALIWIVPFSQSNRFAGPGTWLWTWVMPYQLGQFPAPVAGYPPTGAHAFALAGTAAAAVAALGWRARTALRRGLLLGLGALAIAVVCTAGAAEYVPVPSADVNRLVSDVAAPASVQHCVTDKDVRYCVYPGLSPVLHTVEGPVAAVISHVPARPAHPLMVEQTTDVSLDDASLTHGHPQSQLAGWGAELRDAPAAQVGSSAIYLPISAWPTNRSAAPAARFDLAFATAEWALGLPTSSGSATATQCIPLDQAREPIAIWLAAVATHTQLGTNLAAIMFPVRAANSSLMAWPYPGEYAGYLAAPGPQTTAAGYLLANEMTLLPVQRVAQVLDGAWVKWANPATTDAQLAAALGVAAPTVPAPIVRAPAGQPVVLPQPQPVCGS